MADNRPYIIHGKSLDAMSTASLEALLEAELDSDPEEMDVEKIQVIAAVINERTGQQDTFDVEAGWDSFLHNYYTGQPIYPLPADTSSTKSSESGPRKRPLLRALLAVALIGVLMAGISLSASASGRERWRALLHWTSETFGLSPGQSDTTLLKRNPEYSELKTKLTEAGITVDILPRYLPDGYTQSEVYAEDGYYVGVYSKNEDEIVIHIWEYYNGEDGQNEYDNTALEVYTAGGIDHYIATNEGSYFATWSSSGFECSIFGVPTKEELCRMIDSIYTGD